MLNFANVIGYTRCQRDAKKKQKNAANNPVSDSISSILTQTIVERAKSLI